jgi:hypothetical protein
LVGRTFKIGKRKIAKENVCYPDVKNQKQGPLMGQKSVASEKQDHKQI